MKKAERKELLLQTAYELFLNKGYDSVSVDEIIKKACIAKGTYYYYFKSKEETLEEVLDMMIAKEELKARAVLEMNIPVPQKIVGIISSFRPDENEQNIVEIINRKENLIMHEKVNEKIIETALPLLVQAAKEGMEQGIIHCDYMEERIRILLILSNRLFDEGMTSEATINVYIDTVEKMLGTIAGTMQFIKALIN